MNPDELGNLKLASELVIRHQKDGSILIKQPKGPHYMAIQTLQLPILELFRQKREVRDALQELLNRENQPVRIKDFYDLVVTAWEKGVLYNPDVEADEDKKNQPAQTLEWPAGWGATTVFFTAALFIPIGAYAFMHAPLSMPRTVWDLLIVALVVMVGLTISHVLAATVLRGCGCQVYNPRFVFFQPLPHWSISTCDAFMGGRKCEAAVALQKLLVPFEFALVCWWLQSPAGMMGCLLLLLIQTFPFVASAGHKLIYAVCRKDPEMPMVGPKYLHRKVITQFFDWKGHPEEEVYYLVFSTYAILWFSALVYFYNRIFDADRMYYFEALSNHRGPEALVGSLALTLVVGSCVAYVLWIILFGLFSQMKAVTPHTESVRPQSTKPTSGEVCAFLSGIPLFSKLEEEKQGSIPVLAEKLVFAKYNNRDLIFSQGDIGNNLFIIRAGKVEIVKDNDVGDSVCVATLGVGDLFGEIALLDDVKRTAGARANGEVQLFVLPKEEFQKMLVENLGGETLRTMIQICAFLKRSELFSNWHPQPLFQAAREFQWHPVREGDRLISQGERNDSFYLGYEGEFEVIKNGKPCAKLGTGDFFGEISLMHDCAATADVIAKSDGRCLRLQRNQFYKIITQNFLTGFVLERKMEGRM